MHRNMRRVLPLIPVGERAADHAAYGCVNGAKCDGPGCRLATGKTERDRRFRQARIAKK